MGTNMTASFLLTLSDIGNEAPAYIETLFALSNGHLGVRACAPIQTLETQGNPGTFINGFYDTHSITYGEWAYGYAQKHQTIIKLPSARQLVLIVNGHRSDENEWVIQRDTFQLNLSTGILQEQYTVTTHLSETFLFAITSFVSLTQQEVYASHYQIEQANFSGEIILEKHFSFELADSALSSTEPQDPRVAASKSQLTVETIGANTVLLTTQNSHQQLLLGQVSTTDQGSVADTALMSKLCFSVEPNQIYTAENFVLYSEILSAANVQELLGDFETLMDQLEFQHLVQAQKVALTKFWQVSDIQIKGDSTLQKGLRFNLFQLFQNAGRDGQTNFAAKGLTGQGYEGHYFWDTEMYILPFFIYTQPEIAKALLQYRCQILPQAKERAAIMSQKGALFAWRTINGEEASAYYPAGTAQIHINADISYAFQLYENVTGDHTFIHEQGAQVIFETARFWLSYGTWVVKNGRRQFCLYGVTGPDEYTALVNNNYYTNKMAQNNLFYAVDLAQRYHDRIDAKEQAAWLKAAENMYLPYDEEQQLLKQDDSFLEKERWPFETTPKANYPLLLHYHPMIIYKYQVSKQADGLLAELLFPQDYSKAQILRDYHYYEAVTTHDSSLSRSIFSILASRVDLPEKGYRYFMDTALMDLTDLQGNVKDGIHAANMGGSWLSMIYGFAGLSPVANGWVLENHLPQEIESIYFSLRIRDNVIRVHLTQHELTGEIVETGQALQLKPQANQLWIVFES